MNKYLSILTLSIFLLACQAQSIPPYNNQAMLQGLNETVIEKIAFGSCNRHDMEQPMWQFIDKNEADLWIWLGDIIYGDTRDMKVLKKKYILQKKNKEYKKFGTQTGIIGIWDDHDYGENNAGKEYPKRKESKDLLFEFLEVPRSNPASKREGAYQSYSFGPEGKRIKVILLDCRYFSDKPQRDENGFDIPDPSLDILGKAQWKWLHEELKNSTADIHIIGNGIQVIPEEHPYEKFANFPTTRKKLFDMFETFKPKNLILLSGDRHIAEFSKISLENYPHDIYEITSSGLTHSFDSFEGEENKYRVGNVVSQLNFGLLKFDWQSKSVNISMEIRGLNNDILQFQQIELAY
jgi:alkaline phosphatase D